MKLIKFSFYVELYNFDDVTELDSDNWWTSRIKISYKILQLEIATKVTNLSTLLHFQHALFCGNFAKNTIKTLEVKD